MVEHKRKVVRKASNAIETIIKQMGGRTLRGALCYVGAHKLSFIDRFNGRPNQNSRINDDGTLAYECGLAFYVNGKPKENWRMFVCYEPDDTYSVYLLRDASAEQRQQGLVYVTLDVRKDVYNKELQSTVEQMYDQAINEYNNGCIPD